MAAFKVTVVLVALESLLSDIRFEGNALQSIQAVHEVVQTAQWYVTSLGIPITEVWVTEFGNHWAAIPPSQAARYELHCFLKWMLYSEPYVTRYSWFMDYAVPTYWAGMNWQNMSLVTSIETGYNLTGWGQEYVSLP